jgi:hypothetical protein
VARKTKQLHELAARKWPGHYSGSAPILDASHGIYVGDIAIDLDADAGRNIWKCLSNTVGSPVWRREGAGDRERYIEVPFDSGASLPVGEDLPDGAVIERALVSVLTPFNGSSPTLEIGLGGDVMSTSEIDLRSAGVYVSGNSNDGYAGGALTAAYHSGSSTAGLARVVVGFAVKQ